MTQEEKARAYDKAIEKIMYVIEHGVSPVLNKEDLQDIFPELKESEDDKIRKAIIHYLNDSIGEGFKEKKKKDKIIRWIEWLEEQKEEEKKEEKKEDELLSIAKKEFLNKACRWVENIHDGTYLRNDDCGYTDIHWTEFIKDFRKAMEE